MFIHVIVSVGVKTLEVKEVKKLLNDPQEHFDVVILEWMFSDILSSLATIFNCPLIWMSPVEVNSAVLSLVDVMPSPAYTADDLLSQNMLPLTFKQRVEELYLRLKWSFIKYMFVDDFQTEYYNKLIALYILKRGRQPPLFDVVRYNASLVLGNSHVGMGQGYRLPQSYKHIGGYHIDETVAPLPEDLKKIIENAKHGVIYFSMGSNLKSKDWPTVIKQNLLKMFGELKQTVLWKFEEDLPNIPKNLHILKWAPQQSILSHPNCILFISHGGLLSTTETIHFGVPIIAIPVFGDQFINVMKAVRKGFALKVDLTYDIAKDLEAAIKEMLSNPTYSKRVKDMSLIYHDHPLRPAQELSYWVQHVVRTRGAVHLRSPAIDVPLYQRLYLDLLCLIIIVLLILLRLIKFICSVVLEKQRLHSKNKSD